MSGPLARFPIAVRRLVEERAKRFEMHADVSYTSALAFHPSGRWLVTAAQSSLVVIDLLETRVETIECHAGGLSDVAFDKTGDLLVSVGWDHALCVWDFPARSFVRYPMSKDRLHSVALTADGSTAFTVGHECVLIGVDVRSGKRIVEGTGHRLYCSAVGFSRDESLVISSDSAGDLMIWDRTGKCLKKLDNNPATKLIPYWPISIRALESGEVLLGCRTGSAVILNPTTYQVTRRYEEGHKKCVTDAVALERDGLILTSSEDACVGVWDRNPNAGTEPNKGTDPLLFTFKPEDKWIFALAVAPDEKTFATIGFGGNVKVWDVKTVAMAARAPEKLMAIEKAVCSACGAKLTFVDEVDQLACEKCGGMYDFASVTKKRKARK